MLLWDPGPTVPIKNKTATGAADYPNFDKDELYLSALVKPSDDWNLKRNQKYSPKRESDALRLLT